jgi:hypothetical protein
MQRRKLICSIFLVKSRDSSVGIALDYGLGYRGSWVRFPTLGIFFSTASRTALGPTQPPIQWVPRALSLGDKRPGVKLTTHLHLVLRSKNEWSYISTPPIRLRKLIVFRQFFLPFQNVSEGNFYTVETQYKKTSML